MPERSAGSARVRSFAPGRIFVAIAVVLLITVLLVPWRETSDGGARLTSWSARPGGARGLHDVLDRLGFPVERRLTPLRDELDARALYVILDPIVPPTASEVHALLEAVRAGARLLVLPPLDGRLPDSLRVRRIAVPAPARRDSVRARGADSVPGLGFIRWVLRTPVARDSTTLFEPPAGSRTFFTVATERGEEPMIAGWPLGRGRVVVAAHEEFFQNAGIRSGAGAVRVVRLIEWLRDGDSTMPIVFDEFHQGYGVHADILRVTRRALAGSAPGRVLLHVSGAGLLLLLAIGIRPVRPRPRLRIERRSPLEHVGALARAYAAVDASERAVRLLVRGLRRRHGGGGAGRDETAWLRTLREHKPALDEDVDRVLAALEGDRTHTAGIPAAILNIERAITS